MSVLTRRGLLGGLIASCSPLAVGQVWRPGMQPRFQPGLKPGLVGAVVPIINVLYVAGSSNATSVTGIGSPGTGYDQDPNTLIWNGSAAGVGLYQANVNSYGLSDQADEIGGLWGPEAEFLRLYRIANPTRKILVVKVTRGGTNLSPASSPNWNASSTGSGALALKMRTEANAAHAAITAMGFTPNPIAMLWTHAGNDSNTQANADAAQQRTADLIASFRSSFMGNAAPWIASAIRPAYSGYEFPAPVRAGQIALAQADPKFLLVSLDGITQASEQHPNQTGIVDTGLIYWQSYTGVLKPYIESVSTGSVAENTAYSFPLVAMSPVTWSLAGGADVSKFAVSGSTLTMAAKDFEAPTDADGNNSYVVTVRATQPNGQFQDKTHTVSVTNVDESGMGYEGEADALFSRLTGTYSTAQKTAINTLIKGLKMNGTWAIRDTFGVFKHAKNATDALLDWTKAGSHVNNGAAFSTANGFTTNGTNAWLQMNVDLSAITAHAASSTRVEAGISAFTMSTATEARYAIGAAGGKTVFYSNSPTNIVLGVQSATPSAITGITTMAGRFAFVRNPTVSYSVNGGARVAGSGASSAFSTTAGSYVVLGRGSPTSTNYGAGAFEYFGFGAGTTAAQDAQDDALIAEYLSGVYT